MWSRAWWTWKIPWRRADWLFLFCISSVGWWWCRTACAPPCWGAFHGCWITTSCPTTRSSTSWPTVVLACSVCCCSWSKVPARGAHTHTHICAHLQLQPFFFISENKFRFIILMQVHQKKRCPFSVHAAIKGCNYLVFIECRSLNGSHL